MALALHVADGNVVAELHPDALAGPSLGVVGDEPVQHEVTAGVDPDTLDGCVEDDPLARHRH